MHVATEMYVKERFKRGSTLLEAGDFSCLCLPLSFRLFCGIYVPDCLQ